MDYIKEHNEINNRNNPMENMFDFVLNTDSIKTYKSAPGYTCANLTELVAYVQELNKN